MSTSLKRAMQNALTPEERRERASIEAAPKPTIQVDMFDVQLGAALLVQFRDENGVAVRVLADAGVDPQSHYPKDHVLAPLKQAMKDFHEADLRVDLLMGTHYDADHLDGLIPIINDPGIHITEAWMPPVANDTEQHTLDDQPQERQLLAKQFASENGGVVLQRYFKSKRLDCERLRVLQEAAQNFASERESRYRGPNRETRHRESSDEGVFEGESADNWIGYADRLFKRHFDEASKCIGEEQEASTHADDNIQDPSELGWQGLELYYGQEGLDSFFWWHRWPWLGDVDNSIREYWSQRRDRAAVDARGLAFIRKSTAKDAITASSLYKVVAALRARGIPIACRIIDDGVPRRFVWQRGVRRFIEGPNLHGEPEIVLLGPSRGLVKKHWDRLPIGDYARMMFSLSSAIEKYYTQQSAKLCSAARLREARNSYIG